QTQKSKADTASWENVDRDLFEALRERRLRFAAERQVPPYIIFSDATLRELARIRPSTLAAMRVVYGIGAAKLQDFGATFLQVIVDHCREHGLTFDNATVMRPAAKPRSSTPRTSTERTQAFEWFRAGMSIAEVVEKS